MDGRRGGEKRKEERDVIFFCFVWLDSRGAKEKEEQRKGEDAKGQLGKDGLYRIVTYCPGLLTCRLGQQPWQYSVTLPVYYYHYFISIEILVLGILYFTIY